MKKVAVIGAGLSGLVVARSLDAVADVVLFEKSGRAGGRMSSRVDEGFEFDHGAQFFTARTPAFRAFIEPLISDGIVANWPATFAELDGDRSPALRDWGGDYCHFVGTPRMNRIGEVLVDGLDVLFDATITSASRAADGWTLFDESGHATGQFDWLVLTAPAPQTAALAGSCSELVSICGNPAMLGCYALMLGYEHALPLPWQAALVRNADISWISVNSSKPGRGAPFTLVVHSTNAWAEAHLEDDADNVIEHMLREFEQHCGADVRNAAYRRVHRWRYANVAKQNGPTFFVDDGMRIASCGDWFVRGRVEAAFTSASDLARRLLERM